ncbi:NAD(P)H-binding protein [Gandjariella thermophila]|uniref:Nucleotide-diphosphate-sugar epimerase n=1 Tax=Gandjariella thermophila TaxID=1931992 RepID=A0A4D4J895_9PSEU|nr:NAD(P)H-binding protein [Gandjariella thermophila]GDY31744.1 nucleotide-diphosphate-sugar epimerase [Gandjariella thermophila]
MTILVTGATGHVGRHVVEELRNAGERVRAITRRPDSANLPADVEVVPGDLTEPSALRDALRDVDRVYLFPIPDTAREVVGLIQRAGVRRVAVLSSSSVLEEDAEHNPSAQHHLAVERAVEDTTLEWTFLRPDEFATNTLWKWAPSIRAAGIVRAPYGDAARALIHEADIAAVAARALLEDGHAGKKYELTGPEAITQVEQVRLIGEAIGRDVRFEEVSPEQWREQMSAHMAGPIIEMILEYLAASVAKPGPVTPTVQEVTGRPARTFAEWAVDHAADFR